MSIYKTYQEARQHNERLAAQLIVAIDALCQKNKTVLLLGNLAPLSVNALLNIHHTQNIDINQTLVRAKSLIDDKNDVVELADDINFPNTPKKDVVLYGFGRIGRILARLLLSRPTVDNGLCLKAIVVRPSTENDLQKRASLLEKDSVHGAFDGFVYADEKNSGIVANGRFVRVIYANDPSQIDYTQYDINDALIIDNTGKFKDKDGLGKHLAAKGAQKVLLTAPAKGDIKNIVYGVNHKTIGQDTIVSAASCTTNAITPLLAILHKHFDIDNGHMETVHAFTNDQNLVDNFHKSDRRGRAAPLNMVMTSTGAASAVSKAIPELQGKLTGNAIRVPTPNVSLAILNLNFNKSVGNKDALNELIFEHSQKAKWRAQIDFSNSTEAVSTDFVGHERVAIVDAPSTIAQDKRATLYVWYDNEMGYSTQVLRVAEYMAQIDI